MTNNKGIDLRYVRLVSAVLSLAATSAVLATPALAATAKPPTITSSFAPNLIGVGDTTALGIVLGNPNSSGTLTGVGFTDTLPLGLTIDDPNGVSIASACAHDGCRHRRPGDPDVLAGHRLAEGRRELHGVRRRDSLPAGGVPERHRPGKLLGRDQRRQRRHRGADGAGDANRHDRQARQQRAVRLRPGRQGKVLVGQADYTLGISSCSAQDDLGNTIADGGRLVTNVPGAHQLTVFAISIDGDVATTSVNYTVLPDNRFTVSKVKPKSGGSVSFELGLPGAGKVVALALAGKRTLVKDHLVVHGKQKLQVKLKPAGLGSGGGTVQLRVTYTPKGGVARTISVRGVKLS